MVLVDSSVWITFYNPKKHPTPELDAILALGQAATTDLIMTEVLQGFRFSEKKGFSNALSDLEACVYPQLRQARYLFLQIEIDTSR